MSLTNILLVISMILIFMGCNESIEKVEIKEAFDENYVYDQEDEVYEIINVTFKELIPKSIKSGTTIFLNERLLVADTNLIKEFIENGGNELLYKISRKNTTSKPINLKRIYDFNGIEVLHTYPMTKKEIEKHIGGVIYSRIVFNENKTKASFIFHFERLHNENSKILCAVDVVNKHEKWILASKICLDDHHGVLFE
jgi:hypothetical protein